MMRIAEVVKAAHRVHAGCQGFGVSHQGAGSAGQTVETLAEGGVEPLDEGCIDASLALRLTDEAFDHPLAPLDNAPRDVELASDPLLDHLHDGDIRPTHQLGTAPLALGTRQSGAKRSLKRGHVVTEHPIMYQAHSATMNQAYSATMRQRYPPTMNQSSSAKLRHFATGRKTITLLAD